MSELYHEELPAIKGLKSCLKCNEKIEPQVFQEQLEKGKKLFEAIACDRCNIIYERLSHFNCLDGNKHS